MLRSYESRDFDSLCRLWNSAGVRLGYAPQEPDALARLLTEHPYFDPRFAFMLERDAQTDGFICGCCGDDLPYGGERGYFTCLLLRDTEDRVSGLALLHALEKAFLATGRTCVAANYFNPMKLPWIVPGTPGHQHNNCPGVAEDWPLLTWMRGDGYRVYSRQCAMYLDLSRFETPEWIAEKAAQVAREGYSVEWYDKTRHRGFVEMVHSMHNPMWDAELPVAAETINMLVALQGDTVAGCTGPVYPESTGRGYFAGICVNEQHQKRGLGTLLFYRLCQAEKDAGSRYMSLFTGADGHAQRIYRGAGFEARRTFALVTKELIP